MKTSIRLIDQVRRFFAARADALEGLVVAVSGGPDSVALARALVELRPERPRGPLILAHLNHCLRGKESDTDEESVRQLQRSLAAAGVAQVGVQCDKVDVARVAKAEKANLESVARRVRYDWLANLARRENVAFIATGHTADDQAETVLHHLLRGSGLQGLRGIGATRRLNPHVRVIRPLLGARRSDVLQYLTEKGQAYRLDTSNLDLRYTRNRIRHELLPCLEEEYNCGIVPHLCQLAEQAAVAFRGIEKEARKLLQAAELPRAGALVILDRAILAAAPRNLVRETLRRVWARKRWPLRSMTYRDWDRAASVVLGELTAVDLPGGIRARYDVRVVQLGRY